MDETRQIATFSTHLVDEHFANNLPIDIQDDAGIWWLSVWLLGLDDFEDDAGKNLKMLVSMQLCNLVDLTSSLRQLLSWTHILDIPEMKQLRKFSFFPPDLLVFLREAGELSSHQLVLKLGGCWLPTTKITIHFAITKSHTFGEGSGSPGSHSTRFLYQA